MYIDLFAKIFEDVTWREVCKIIDVMCNMKYDDANYMEYNNINRYFAKFMQGLHAVPELL